MRRFLSIVALAGLALAPGIPRFAEKMPLRKSRS